MHLEPFSYARPSNLGEFEGLLVQQAGEANIMAGGTDLLVLVKEKVISPKSIIDIGGLSELQGISWDRVKGLTILAGTKVAEIEKSGLVKEHAPALAYAAGELGSPQVRHMATMGGNVCHASPSAETPPVLLSHGTELTLVRKGAERRLLIEEFFLSYRKTALQPGEYLRAFRLPPLPPRSAVTYRCRGLRRAMEIDMVNVGVYLELEPDHCTAKAVRVALGAVGPIPYRATATEKALTGRSIGEDYFEEAGRLAAEEARPIDDVRASATYRKKMVYVLVKRALEAAAAEIGEIEG